MIDRTKNSVKPFWSLNDKLDKNELQKQIQTMKDNGIEGFFMHARGGLRTEYMSDEWFEMIKACMDKADELGMQAWAYDENGWPSGFADGVVPALGRDYQQKSLNYVIFDGSNMPDTDKIIASYDKNGDNFVLTEKIKEGTCVFFYNLNPYYIDAFNKDTISEFLKATHEKYYKLFGDRFGTSLKGFFIDEPQFRGFPWSHVFINEFENRFGYSLLENMPALAFEVEGYEAVRNDYYTMVSALMADSFIKQIYDWCTEHNCMLTGHMMAEDHIEGQMNMTGSSMALYDYFHEPGIDHLGRKICSPVVPKQLGSVARQLGKKTLTETFALCGWDVSLNELKWIAQWQYLNGVTSLCPHLEGYSLRGIRKRDYPASLFIQLPWFRYVYTDFADYFTSLGTLLDSATDISPVLIIHPIHSAFTCYKVGENNELKLLSDEFDDFAQKVNNAHIINHYGDEDIIERYGSVNGEKLTIGNYSYGKILLPSATNFKSNTVKVLLDFISNGGQVFAIGKLPEFEEGRRTENISKLASLVTACADLKEFKEYCKEAASVELSGNKSENIHLNIMQLENGRKLLYMINNIKEEVSVKVCIDGKYSISLNDIISETETKLSCEIIGEKTYFDFDFQEYGSAIIFLDNAEESCNFIEKTTETIKLDKIFDISYSSENALTLDKCEYRFDGGEWQDEIAVINLFNKALELQKTCDIEMKFKFNIGEEFDFSSVCLCMEDPEKFRISINGKEYKFEDCGMYIDHSFRKSNIGDYLVVGENTILMNISFVQSEEIYYAKFTPGVHESVLNKLTYETELESIYITGNFGVNMAEEFRLGERRCIHGGKTFTLVKPNRQVDITDITRQNYWFFAGEIDLVQNVNVLKNDDKRYIVSFKHLNAPAAQVFVNGNFAGNIAFAPFTLDVSDFIADGINEIKIKMLSGNRNLLGPHHRPYGESYFVGPATFSDKNSWADDPDLPPWTDNYSFVLFGADI